MTGVGATVGDGSSASRDRRVEGDRSVSSDETTVEGDAAHGQSKPNLSACDGFDLGRAAPAAESKELNGPHPASKDDACREVDWERRLGDQELRDALATSGFAGPIYDRFEEELAAYGIAVLRSWLHSGYIFTLAARRGYHLRATEVELEELARDSDSREELSNMTVAIALHRFREHALIAGGWRADGGASLTTYFMGACLDVFPNEFRKARASVNRQLKVHRQVAAAWLSDNGPAEDPAVIVAGQQLVIQHLTELDPRTQATLALSLDGYTQPEIAELLGESVRAQEGLLHRWRGKQQACGRAESDA